MSLSVDNSASCPEGPTSKPREVHILLEYLLLKFHAPLPGPAWLCQGNKDRLRVSFVALCASSTPPHGRPTQPTVLQTKPIRV